MAQTGYTPIRIYSSPTTTNVPLAANLAAGELAINTADGKLFYKDSSNVVQVIGTKGGVGSSSTTQVLYNSSGLVVGSGNLTFDGTVLTSSFAGPVAATTLSASSTVSGTGFSTYLASPPAIGGTTPAAGAFTTLSASSTVSGTGFSTYLASPPAIGGTAAAAGSFTKVIPTGGTAAGNGMYLPATNAIAWSNNGAETMRLNASGILLVGTTSASGSNKLQVSTDALINGVTVGTGKNSVSSNTVLGTGALGTNTTGYRNVAIGEGALRDNTTGAGNTVIGGSAMLTSNGNNNSAVGASALQNNTSGSNNTAVGLSASQTNTTGNYNSAFGSGALSANTTGGYNTAVGTDAIIADGGSYNTANGWQALYRVTGSYNTAVGIKTLFNTTTGSGNVMVGGVNSAGTYAPVFDPSTQDNRLCMGSTAVTNAYVQVAWTVVSDARDKTDFAPVPHGLDFVCKLKPTAYRYKETREATEGHGPVRYGFKAQDVLAEEGANSVIVDNEDPEKLRFNDQSMIAVLVNAIKELKAEFDAYKASHP